VKLSELAAYVQGQVVGDGTIEITGVKGINEAGPGEITFLSHNRYKKAISQSKASAVIAKEMIEGLSLSQLLVNNPYYAFAKTLEIFYKNQSPPPGISQNAYISPEAHIDEGATIFEGVFVGPLCHIARGAILYPGVYVAEGSKVGEGTIVHPNVTIREKVAIGKNVIIHAGSVIGSDGFGYVFENGKHHKIPQVGGVVVEDNVEIGANVSIDRATMGNTIIGSGTKIDNLVQIAHNVKIGQNCIIVAQTGISGSSVLGNSVILAGQVGVVDHVTLADRVMIGAKSGVSNDIKEAGAYSGIPAIPHKVWLKAQALYAKLPELAKRLREIERLSEKEQSKG